jgi:hypothetical protein
VAGEWNARDGRPRGGGGDSLTEAAPNHLGRRHPRDGGMIRSVKVRTIHPCPTTPMLGCRYSRVWICQVMTGSPRLSTPPVESLRLPPASACSSRLKFLRSSGSGRVRHVESGVRLARSLRWLRSRSRNSPHSAIAEFLRSGPRFTRYLGRRSPDTPKSDRVAVGLIVVPRRRAS